MKTKNLLSALENIFFFGRFFLIGRVYPGFVPKKSELVIDVGCGDKPFWRSDVCLDDLSLGNDQRYSSNAVVKNFGYFVDSSIYRMPFKNKAFDFSFCSHVLEHVDDPAKAIEEITRISKRGYIELPDGVVETMFPYQSHLWFIFLQKEELVFIRKSKKVHNTLLKNGTKYLHLPRYMKDPFIRLYWKGKIKYKIIDETPVKEKFFSTPDKRFVQPHLIYKLYLLFTAILRRLFYKKKDEFIRQTLILEN